MGLLQCLKLLAPVIVGVLIPFLGITGVGIYKLGLKNFWRVFLSYLSSGASWIHLLWSMGVFKALAVITTFSGTLDQGLNFFQGEGSFFATGRVFLNEFVSKLLNATGNIAEGLSLLVDFVSFDGICTVFYRLDILLDALVSMWQGVAAIILLLWMHSWYRGRWQKAEVDKHEQGLVLMVFLLASAVIQAGLDATQLGSILDNMSSLLDALGQGNETINSTANETVNSTSPSTSPKSSRWTLVWTSRTNLLPHWSSWSSILCGTRLRKRYSRVREEAAAKAGTSVLERDEQLAEDFEKVKEKN